MAGSGADFNPRSPDSSVIVLGVPERRSDQVATFTVDLTDECQVRLSFPEGLTPRVVTLDFAASTEDELRELVRRLGFDAAEMDPVKLLHVRYNAPLFDVDVDGRVGWATVHLWIEGDLAEGRTFREPPVRALERLRDEALAARSVPDAV